ncbi:hypothetical protein Naga_100026g47 [Nannochloropsis gaditana]|uniref:Snurportin-1 n=2 Tax=Nannochloropsis gaditana TaxID=72520 RepID=W7UC62_9STRA|nr:hypothetical protein Naga_100026g47 [Nannochloropsis gaditana]
MQHLTDASPQQRPYPKSKLISSSSSRDKRRSSVLQRQRAARRELTDSLRALHRDTIAEDDVDSMTRSGNGSQLYESDVIQEDDGMMVDGQGQVQAEKIALRRKRARARQATIYANRFAIPEWMIEIPHDLHPTGGGGGWLVMPQPMGKRCLMAATGGLTLTRMTSGEVLHRLASPLPNGSAWAKGPKNGWTLLDCVYQESSRTYYVLDLLCWRKMELYDCACDFRLFFLRSKFAEEMEHRAGAILMHGTDASNETFHLELLPWYECHRTGLQMLRSASFPFEQDGFLFWNKEGYVQAGLTPLILLWKDAHSSHSLYRDSLLPRWSAVLSVRLCEDPGEGKTQDYLLLTLEGLAVGSVTRDEFHRWSRSQEQGEAGSIGGEGDIEGEGFLVCFWYEEATEDETSQEHRLHGLTYRRICVPSSETADCWSKLLFQSRVKRGMEGGAVTFDMLLCDVEREIAHTGTLREGMIQARGSEK